MVEESVVVKKSFVNKIDFWGGFFGKKQNYGIDMFILVVIVDQNGGILIFLIIDLIKLLVVINEFKRKIKIVEVIVYIVCDEIDFSVIEQYMFYIVKDRVNNYLVCF